MTGHHECPRIPTRIAPIDLELTAKQIRQVSLLLVDGGYVMPDVSQDIFEPENIVLPPPHE